MSKLLLCGLLIFLWAATGLAGSKIECDDPKHDFGTRIEGGDITNRFILWNRGDEPLEIVKVKDCCGVRSTVDPVIIAPGSNAVCTSVFNTKNRYGGQDKQILLITNDKKNLYFDLRLTGKLLKPIEFSPPWINLGSLLADDTISETITATNMLEQAVTLSSVSTTVDGIAARIAEAKERCWKIQMVSSSPLSLGRLSGTVRLEFSTGTVDVPVVGMVKPVVQPTPEKILLRSASSVAVERLVLLRSGDGRSFEVLSANLENIEGKISSKKLDDGKWQILLTIKPLSIVSPALLRITTTADSLSVLEIPLAIK